MVCNFPGGITELKDEHYLKNSRKRNASEAGSSSRLTQLLYTYIFFSHSTGMHFFIKSADLSSHSLIPKESVLA